MTAIRLVRAHLARLFECAALACRSVFAPPVDALICPAARKRRRAKQACPNLYVRRFASALMFYSVVCPLKSGPP